MISGMNRTKSWRGQPNTALAVHGLLTIHGPNLNWYWNWSLFGWFTFVEMTSRCACCPIVRTCKYLFIYFYLSSVACPRDLHNMIAYTSCRPLLRPSHKYILNTEHIFLSSSVFFLQCLVTWLTQIHTISSLISIFEVAVVRARSLIAMLKLHWLLPGENHANTKHRYHREGHYICFLLLTSSWSSLLLL